MAVELWSDNCGVATSPRISFSRDFSQSDVIPVEQHALRSNSSGLDSSIDFDFCVPDSFELESSSADELFSDGRILPSEIKKKRNDPWKKMFKSASQPPLPQPQVVRGNSSSSRNMKSPINKEIIYANDEADEKQSTKSFWGFNRSSSCGSGYRGRSFCPLPLLSRSSSTGSSQSFKRMQVTKEGTSMKQNSQKNASTKSSHYVGPNNYQKPPLKKPYGSYYGNGVQVNPILNVPTGNLFGLGSIFSNNRDKTKKR